MASRTPPDLVTITKTGDRRKTLEAVRDLLAVAIASGKVGARDLAALTRQLTDVVRELDELPNAREASPVDDLASKRAARRAAAQVPERADGADKRRAGGGGTRRKRGTQT